MRATMTVVKATKTGCPKGLARVWKYLLNISTQNEIISFSMAEQSSDMNILRLRLNQFLRKRKLIYSGNFQLSFKHYKGRVCFWHT